MQYEPRYCAINGAKLHNKYARKVICQPSLFIPLISYDFYAEFWTKSCFRQTFCIYFRGNAFTDKVPGRENLINITVCWHNLIRWRIFSNIYVASSGIRVADLKYATSSRLNKMTWYATAHTHRHMHSFHWINNIHQIHCYVHCTHMWIHSNGRKLQTNQRLRCVTISEGHSYGKYCKW